MTERDERRKQLLEAADELGEVDEDGPYTWPLARAIMAELDASERKRFESLTALREQIQGLQRRNNTRIDLVQQDIRDLYLASFSP